MWNLSAKMSTFIRAQYGMGARFAIETLVLNYKTMRDEGF